MKLFHTHYNSRLHSIVHSDFWHYELAVWLHMVGWSIISLFIPILLLTAGYSLVEVLVYEAFFYLIDTPLNFLASSLTARFGAKVVVIAGTLSAIANLVLFHYLFLGGWGILLTLALLAALYDTLYYVAHIYLFIESSGSKREISKSTGILASVHSFAGMLGPTIGALVLIFGNQSALLATSIVFLSLSILPLFWLHHLQDKPKENGSFKGFFKEFPEKLNFLDWFLFSIHRGVEDVIWPIFIFTQFGSLKSIAYIAVVISVTKIIIANVSGRISWALRDRFIFFGVLITLLVWVARILFPNPIFYYLSVSLMGLCAIMVETPLDSSVFERARFKKQTLAASTYRNTIIMFPQGVMFLVLILFVQVFKVSFGIAISGLLALLVFNQLLIRIKTRIQEDNK